MRVIALSVIISTLVAWACSRPEQVPLRAPVTQAQEPVPAEVVSCLVDNTIQFRGRCMRGEGPHRRESPLWRFAPLSACVGAWQRREGLNYERMCYREYEFNREYERERELKAERERQRMRQLKSLER